MTTFADLTRPTDTAVQEVARLRDVLDQLEYLAGRMGDKRAGEFFAQAVKSLRHARKWTDPVPE